MKRFHYLGYIVEYLPLSRTWAVIDWDYETPADYAPQIGPAHKSKAAALAWIERQLG